jgi:hypothetical protein
MVNMHADPTADPRFLAGVDLLRRTGAASFQMRYSDDEQPVVWIAVSEWKLNDEGHPMPKGDHAGTYFDAAAATSPLGAVLRLCDLVVDGGHCVHCGKPTAVSDKFEEPTLLPEHICWYIFDPELETFRRSCEGE